VAISIQDESPASGDVSYSLRPIVSASIRGDPLNVVLRPNISVNVSGVKVIENGVVLDDFTGSIRENAFLGVDFSFRPKFDFPINSWVSIVVSANSEIRSWSFRLANMSPPYLANELPLDGSDGNVPFPTVEFDIVNGVDGVSRRVLESSSVIGSLSAMVLTVPDIDLRRSTGKLIIVNGVPGFVLSVIGPNKVLTDIIGSGSGLPVELYRNFGIDVAIDGERIIKSGHILPSSKWSTALTEPSPGIWHVESSRISDAFPTGKLVSVSVTATGADVSMINIGTPSFEFYVGDTRGPSVYSVDPKPGARGLAVSQAVSQPEMDIVDLDSGVLLSSINIQVSGVPAIAAGVAQAGWVGSSISPIGGGYHVTLVRSTDWSGGHETFHVQASDNVGNPMDPPATWILHFGAVSESVPLTTGTGDLVDNDVVGVVPFDLSATSFARPMEMRHTGYAWDGRRYSEGALLDEPMASWFSEAAGPDRSSRGTFPLTGFFVLTQTGWSIVDAAGEMWMRCSALSAGTISEWSMGGNIVYFNNIKISSTVYGGPLFGFSTEKNITLVNFEEDRARRITPELMEIGTGSISSRNSNQSGGSQQGGISCCEPGDTIEAFACLLLSTYAGEAWVAITAVAGRMYVSGDLSSALEEIEAEIGEGATSGAATVVYSFESDLVAGVMPFYVLKKGSVCPVFILHQVNGDTVLSIVDWLAVFAYLTGGTLFDYTISSDVPSSLDVNIDKNRFIACVAMNNSVEIISIRQSDGQLESTIASLSKVDLTLDTVVGGDIVFASMSPHFTPENGYVYVSAASPSAGKTVRYRHQPVSASLTGQVMTIDSGKPVSVGVLDDADLVSSRFLRSSVVIASAGQEFVRASLEVE